MYLSEGDMMKKELEMYKGPHTATKLTEIDSTF